MNFITVYIKRLHEEIKNKAYPGFHKRGAHPYDFLDLVCAKACRMTKTHGKEIIGVKMGKGHRRRVAGSAYEAIIN